MTWSSTKPSASLVPSTLPYFAPERWLTKVLLICVRLCSQAEGRKRAVEAVEEDGGSWKKARIEEGVELWTAILESA